MKNKEEMQLVEKIKINKNDKYFNMLLDFCHKSKNLYNHSLYHWRQNFFEKKILSSFDIIKYESQKENDYDYRNMPIIQASQQTIVMCINNCTSFLKSLKAYKKNPKKFNGKPKIPKYLDKDGYFIVTLTNQNVKVKDNKILFPKSFNGFNIIPNCINRKDFIKLNQVRIHPICKKYEIVIQVEIIYTIKKEAVKLNKNRYCGIDLGVENLAALSFNCNKNPLLFKGKKIKSVNQYFNKVIAKYTSITKKTNNQNSSKRIERLWRKRENIINDILHKTSRKIVEECKKNKVKTLVIGKNKNWKKKKEGMQNFVFIPFNRLIQMIKYKAEMYGMKVIEMNESYTSGTSFLDKELPNKNNYNKNRRMKRGLFVSNDNVKVNADINASYQIIQKYFIAKGKNEIYDFDSYFSPFINWSMIVNTIKVCA